MPDKEGSDDEKKSTKSVVNKKQKQMMGEEGYDIARDEGRVSPSKDKKDATTMPVSDEVKKTQKKSKGKSALELIKKKYGKAVMNVDKKKANEELDLTKVADSFGGEIIGEPVELDEGKLKLFTYGARALKFLKSKPGRKITKQFSKTDEIENARKLFNNIINKQNFKPNTPIKPPFKPLKPLKDFIATGTEKAKTQFSKIKDSIRSKKTKNSFKNVLNKNQNKNKSKIGTKEKVAAAGITAGVGTIVGTQLNKGKKGKFPSLRPRLPQTSHNVGRTSNPQ